MWNVSGDSRDERSANTSRLKREFDAMSAEFGTLAPRMTPAFGNPTIT